LKKIIELANEYANIIKEFRDIVKKGIKNEKELSKEYGNAQKEISNKNKKSGINEDDDETDIDCFNDIYNDCVYDELFITLKEGHFDDIKNTLFKNKIDKVVDTFFDEYLKDFNEKE